MGIILNRAIESKIDGVTILSLKQIEDERGAVLHMLRSDSPVFSKFGEIYFSIVNPGTVKAWKRHKKMTQHFAVPMGRIRLVLFDDRADSRSKEEVEEIILGRPGHYFLLCIPPMLWYGFKCISSEPALIANCTDLPHDPDETEKKNPGDRGISYQW